MNSSVDEVEQQVRRTAEMICAEQPDMGKPESLQDLDSFSMVQVLLELENTRKVSLLEQVEGLTGGSYRDLAELVVRLESGDGEGPRAAVIGHNGQSAPA